MSNKKNKHLTLHRHEAFIGPIPPPAVLQQYNDILPNAAERILAMAEKQSAHRQDLEGRVIRSDVRSSHLGLVFGLIIGLCGMACATKCILAGQAWPGSFLGGGTLVSLVGTFVYGSRSRRKEREAKESQQRK